MIDRVDRRKSKVRQPSPMPLMIVAGLPSGPAQYAKRLIETRLVAPCRSISIPTRPADSSFYTRDYIDQVLAAAVSFAARRRAKKDQNTTPQFVVLLYVPAEDEENLLTAFDFSAFPIALPSLALRDLRSKLLRHDEAAVLGALTDAFSRSGEHWSSLQTVLERLRSRRAKDAILLPPRNFQAASDRLLSELFRELRRGHRDWTSRFPELNLRDLGSKELPRLPEQKVVHAFQDARDLVFLPAHPTAYHGATRELDEIGREAAIDLLSSLYRFGAPVDDGFHHDVQYEKGRPIKKIEFFCRKRGSVRISGTHVNIYANDFVRGSK